MRNDRAYELLLQAIVRASHRNESREIVAPWCNQKLAKELEAENKEARVKRHFEEAISSCGLHLFGDEHEELFQAYRRRIGC